MRHCIIIALVVLLTFSGCSRKVREYAPENPVESDVVTMVNSDVTAGQATWLDFWNKQAAGEPATVSLEYTYELQDPSHYDSSYYEENKNNYPVTYKKELVYDGEKFVISGYEDDKLITHEFKYLLKMEGVPTSAHAEFSRYTFFVLVDIENMTWDIIERGLISSQSGDSVDHYKVYSDYIYNN